MSELKTSPTNDPVTKKPLPIPRSTKTSRAREIYLQRQASLTPSTSAASTTPTIPKTIQTKPKAFKATPAPSYLGKKNPSKPSSLKLGPEPITNKDIVKNELKSMDAPHATQGDVADEDFEIVQLNEIKDNNSTINSPRPNTDATKIPDVTETQPVEQLALPPLETSLQSNLKKTNTEVEIIAQQEKKFDTFEPNNLNEVNPCDAIKQPQGTAVEDLESKLEEREKDIVKLETSLKEATNELKRLEEEYSYRLNDLTTKLNESEQRLEKSIEECNQHKQWVDNTESKLSTMKIKFYESEQKMLAQEEDLRRLLRWSNIKNASIVTCAATAIAYYHVKK